MNDDIQATGQQQVTPAFSSSLASPSPAPALYSDAGDDYATEQQQASANLMPEQPVLTDDIAALSQSRCLYTPTISALFKTDERTAG